MTSEARENELAWRAQLADMPFEAICAYLREQGYAVVPIGPIASWQMISARDRLPPGYPPRAEDDEEHPEDRIRRRLADLCGVDDDPLPFEVE